MPSPRPLVRPASRYVEAARRWLQARDREPFDQLTREERHAVRYVRQERAARRRGMSGSEAPGQ